MRTPPPPHNVRLSRIFFVGLLSAVAVVFFLFNLNTPMYADDYSYCFSFYDGQRITSVLDIFPSMWAHYSNMNGRLVTHFLAQLYLMLDKNVFNVVNTGVFIGLGLLIYRFSGFGFRTPRPAMLAAIFMILYWFTPDFAESYLWTDAACTYLHGVVLVLMFLLPYWEHFRFQKSFATRRSVLISFTLANLLFGFLAGAASETFSLAMIFMVCALLTAAFFQKRLEPWMITGLIGSILGYLFMLLAPGNGLRISAFDQESGLWRYIWNLMYISYQLLKYFNVLLVLFAAMLVVFFRAHRKEPVKEIFLALLPMLIVLMGAGISLYSAIAVDYFPLRAWSGTVALAAIACGTMLSQLKLSPSAGRKARAAVSLALLLTMIHSVVICGQLHIQMEQYQARTESIRQQIAAGNQDIWIPQLQGTNKFSCFWEENTDIGPDAAHWTNTIVAKYWGVSTVNMLP